MQAAGCLVGSFFEFSAELEHGHHTFQCGDFAPQFLGQLLVPVDRNPPPIILDRDRGIVVDVDRHHRCETGHRLVNRVIDDFINEMVQAPLGRVADIHARPLANMLQVRQVLQVVGRVLLVRLSAGDGPDLLLAGRAIVTLWASIAVRAGITIRAGVAFRF